MNYKSFIAIFVLLVGVKKDYHCANAFSFGFENETEKTEAEKACDLKVEEQARKAMASILRVTKLFRKFEEVANDLYNKLDALQKVYAQVQGSFTSEQKNHEETKKLLENLNKAKLEAASELETLHKENDELKKVLAATKENYIKVETTLKEKEEKYKLLEQDNTLQKSKVAYYSNLVNERETTIAENQKKCDENVKTERDAKETCHSKLTTQTQEYSDQIANINKQCDTDKNQLKAALTTLNTKVEDCEASKLTLKKEKEAFEQNFNKIKSQLDSEKTNHESLKQTSLEAKTRYENNIQDLLAQFTKLKQEKVERDTEIANLKKENTDLQTQSEAKIKSLNEQCTQDKNTLNTAITKLKEDITSKVTEMKNLEETKNAEIARLIQEKQDLSTESENNLKRLKDEHAKAMTLLNIKISQLENDMKICNANNHELTGKLTTLEETKKQEIAKLNADITALKLANEAALKTQTEKCQADISKLTSDKNAIIQELTNDYKTIDETKKQEIAKLNADIAALKLTNEAALKTQTEKCQADLEKLKTDKDAIIQKFTTYSKNLEVQLQKCNPAEILLSWMPSSGGVVPPNAVAAANGLWVGRAKYANIFIPGKIAQGHPNAYVPYGGYEKSVSHYQVLVKTNLKAVRDDELYTWVQSDGKSVPKNALLAGLDGSNQMFVARGTINGDTVVGKFYPTYSRAYFPWGGREHVSFNFQVLCLKR